MTETTLAEAWDEGYNARCDEEDSNPEHPTENPYQSTLSTHDLVSFIIRIADGPVWGDSITRWMDKILLEARSLRAILEIPDHQREALIAAERFIVGFEGDETQEGIDDLLHQIRTALKGT